jgi:hypothetical protein
MKHFTLCFFLGLHSIAWASGIIAFAKNHPFEQNKYINFVDQSLNLICPGTTRQTLLKEYQSNVEIYPCPALGDKELVFIRVTLTAKKEYYMSAERISYETGLLLSLFDQVNKEPQWQNFNIDIANTEQKSSLKLSLNAEGACSICKENALAKEFLGAYRIVSNNTALKILSRKNQSKLERSNLLIRESKIKYQINDGLFKDLVYKDLSLEELKEKLGLMETYMQDPKIRVVKKWGAWVYLNKGRSYGLNIRDRLVLGDDIGLHVVSHYSSAEQIMDQDHLIHDGAIAYVRKGQDKIKLGDVVLFDPTTYPTPFNP